MKLFLLPPISAWNKIKLSMKLGQVSDLFKYIPSLGQIPQFFRQEEQKDELKQTLHVLSLCCAVSVTPTQGLSLVYHCLLCLCYTALETFQRMRSTTNLESLFHPLTLLISRKLFLISNLFFFPSKLSWFLPKRMSQLQWRREITNHHPL